MSSNPISQFQPTLSPLEPVARWQRWWRRQPPLYQDRLAMMAPVAAVVLFLAAIATSFWYLRAIELERERETLRHDLEYAQQQMRLRLLERQAELMRLSIDISNKDADELEFARRAEALLGRSPELLALTWIDAQRNIAVTQSAPSLLNDTRWTPGDTLPAGDTEHSFSLARDLMQPVYSVPLRSSVGQIDGGTSTYVLELHTPLNQHGQFAGVVLAEYALDALLRHTVPSELQAKYDVNLLDSKDLVVAGQPPAQRPRTTSLLPWVNRVNEERAPVSPVGNGLVLRLYSWHSSVGMVGNSLFWLVGALSVLTSWMLLANWRHTRRRLQAQHELQAETAFRRAMEDSMLTGMRALDMSGCITYVNPAFCRMTGWTEEELVGKTPPFPYWPDEDVEMLALRLDEELHGRSSPGGFQVRVKRRDGSLFDARLYVSPLIDTSGQQTGWMTAMTDITEPNRIREQLSASYERFTAVLEALDASVSVAPLGSEELLFANKLYRQWFGTQAHGHLQLIEQGGNPDLMRAQEMDDVDSFAGLPTGALTQVRSENTELFVPQLGRWIEVRSRYLNWVDGRLAQMVIATDITARHAAEELAASQAARAQAVSRLVTMGEMASSVAHELNQPLTAISNYCNGMVSRIKNGSITLEDLVPPLEKTAKQAQRAGQIIQRIRSFVKRSEPKRAWSDVTTMVEEARELAEIELRRRNVRLSHYVAARLPKLHVDPILVEQVLVNLMKNAAEAIDAAERPSAERNVELRVLPRQAEGQNVVEFAVIDSGPGLSEEVQERLYEAFFSTKAQGMGIGLSLCRSIIESHQGRMQAENLYNGKEVVGCRFSFWVPVADPHASNDKSETLGANNP